MYVVQLKPPSTGLPASAPSSGLPVSGSTLAAMAFQIGSNCDHASRSPPGIKDGPKRAPSSPPDTPEPMKRRPLAVRFFSRRIVSPQFALPPSMMMSPSSKRGIRPSITLSVAQPACTRITIFRGRFNDATKLSSVSQPSRPPGVFGLDATKPSILERVRL